ncbi:MAG TPA: hypothetical protein VF950_06725 [Planctomycetota bacterium]
MTDRDVVDLQGRPRRLKEFRRRSHVLLYWDPKADVEAWTKAREAEAQRWIWLQTVLVRPAAAPDVDPGIHFINRWGELVESFPPTPWDTARLEEVILRFEDRDCCDLRQAP